MNTVFLIFSPFAGVFLFFPSSYLCKKPEVEVRVDRCTVFVKNLPLQVFFFTGTNVQGSDSLAELS